MSGEHTLLTIGTILRPNGPLPDAARIPFHVVEVDLGPGGRGYRVEPVDAELAALLTKPLWLTQAEVDANAQTTGET